MQETDDKIELVISSTKTLLKLLWPSELVEATVIEDKSLVDQLLLLDPKESLYHIEIITRPTNTIYKVWRKRIWDESYERWTRQKQWSEDNRQRSYIKEENLIRLTRSIVAKLIYIEQIDAQQMAYRLIQKAGENYETAQYKTVKESIKLLYGYSLQEYNSPVAIE